MLHTTKGIVLRTIKYGDTSIVVSIYTELFGVQSYLVNGVRTEKRSASKANIYQPSTMLDLVVYHAPNKNLQRIREARVNHIYREAQQHVVKNTIAIYLVELIHKTITEPETNAELFEFFEQSFLHIDAASSEDLADFPILFTLQLADRLGFGIHNIYSEKNNVFDLQHGQFCNRETLTSFQFVEGESARLLSHYVSQQEFDKADLLNQTKRKELLGICLLYLRLHIPHLSELKSVEILHEVLS